MHCANPQNLTAGMPVCFHRFIHFHLLILTRVACDFSFVAIGDWGGASDDSPTTESQQLAASGIASIVNQIDAQFVLMMGDNFYYHGIQNHGDRSSRFKDTFEDVYVAKLPNTKFFALCGNHDYGEGIRANVSAQLDYARHSSNWNFPALWYKKSHKFSDNGTARVVDLLIIDTVVMCGVDGMSESLLDEELREAGYGHGINHRHLRRHLAEKHWAWLQAELTGSTADFLWVSGHYPIWSAGNDGPTPCLIQRLYPMLKRHGAHYISGHDHNLEHMFKDGVHMFVAGAGKECCYPPISSDEVPHGVMKYMLSGFHGRQSTQPVPFPVFGGFASFQFKADWAQVTLHAHNGTILYKAPPIARRAFQTIQLYSSTLEWLKSSSPLAISTSVLGLSFFALVLDLCRKRHKVSRRGYDPLLGPRCAQQ